MLASKPAPLTISPAQCRAARALLDWSQDDLELRSGVAKRTISKFESMVSHVHPASAEMLRHALESGGVEFLDEDGHGAGVRFASRGAA